MANEHLHDSQREAVSSTQSSWGSFAIVPFVYVHKTLMEQEICRDGI